MGELLSTVGNGELEQPIHSVFNFLPDTNNIIVVDSSALDRETVVVYRFEVIATNSGGLSDTATVMITITDFNDEAPQITNPM